jgi:2'-phosphotransferase
MQARKVDYEKISKKLAWALRHGIDKLGVHMNPAGYVNLKELLSKPDFSSVTVEIVETIVSSDNKNRYGLLKENEEVYIRANQGHSIKQVKDEELLAPITNPEDFPVVVHGTNKASWKFIKTRGLYKMERNHIHFAIGLPGENQVISGARVKCEVFIFINLSKAIEDGIKFFVSQNSVVLTPGINGFVPPIYFSKVLINRQEIVLDYSPISFDYILVLDFEANCTEDGTMVCQEIIEFPVKALNCKTLNIDYVFHEYIKPEVVPELTEFCTKLTGITQDMVSSQEPLLTTLNKFHDFLLSTGLMDTKWIFATCGDWDLKTCLNNETEYKKIPLKEYFCGWVNIKTLVPKFKGGMMEMIKMFNIEHTGRHHSGIDDVTNICECLKFLLHSGVQITPEDLHINKPKLLGRRLPVDNSNKLN